MSSYGGRKYPNNSTRPASFGGPTILKLFAQPTNFSLLKRVRPGLPTQRQTLECGTLQNKVPREIFVEKSNRKPRKIHTPNEELNISYSSSTTVRMIK
jgi:hypothetical protein